MIHVHQAIYGDANGAYSLLYSSFPDQDIPKRLGNTTDLIDRPPEGVLSTPVLRGFPEDKYFLLIRSFPDVSPNVRRGRVFSHVLFIELKDFLKINDISALLQHHLKVIDKEAKLQVIEMPVSNIDSNPEPTNEARIASAINGLVDHANYDNTVVWIGEPGYLGWIFQIWPAIPNPVKSNLRIGVALNPQKINTKLLNLIYVPIEVKQNWSKTKFKLVEAHAEEILRSQVANLLAGKLDKAHELQELLIDFVPTIKEIDDLLQFEKMIEVHRSLKGNKDNNLKQLLLFADLVSKYNSNPKSASTTKSNLLQAIATEVKNAEAKEIYVLNNPNWSGFEDAPHKLSSALSFWLDKNLLKKGSGIVNAPIIEKAFSNNERSWWERTVLDQIKTSFSNWQSQYAACIWDWFVTKPQLVDLLKSLLPNEAQTDLALALPVLPQNIANKILQLAQQKKWLQLHGIITIKLYSAQEALFNQLKIDTDSGHIQAFENMANEIEDKKFISATLELQDQRLYFISGKLCHNNPKLLGELNIEQIGWQEIWIETIKQSKNIWAGISKPIKTLYGILDLILKGQSFKEDLLSKISNSSINDLSKYPRRKEIWDLLPSTSRTNFLTATAKSLIEVNENQNLSLVDLETPLSKHIQSPSFIKAIIPDTSIELLVKLKLIKGISSVEVSEVIGLINNNRFSSSEAKILGQTILINNWRPAASYVHSVISHRPDLTIALKECKGLLDFSQRISLWARGILSQTITEEEWWDALKSRAIVLYPQGPDQNGIWEAAGGHNADLIHNTTGKEKWKYALRGIQNGGKPNIQNLIKEMLVEFPHDDLLNKLKNTK